MPLQKLSGVASLVFLQECGFSRVEPYTGQPTLQSHRPKLGLRSTSSNAKTKVKLSFGREKVIFVVPKEILSSFLGSMSKLKSSAWGHLT